MKTFKRTLLACSVVASISAVVALLATPSQAFDRRIHGSACMAINGITNFISRGNISTTNSLQAECPIPTDSDIRKFQLRTVNLHFTDNSTSFGVWVQACVEFWDFNGGECGSVAQSSAGGTGTSGLGAPLNGPNWLRSEGDFAYLLVLLPPAQQGTSLIKGYFMAS